MRSSARAGGERNVRFGPAAGNLERQLHAQDVGADGEAPGQVLHEGGVLRSLRAHVDEQPVDELDRLAVEGAGGDHPVVGFGREPMQGR